MTERERELLTLIAQGKTRQEIAEQCGISKTTVIVHLKHARQKLGAKNLARAVAIAILSDEIDP